MGREVYMPKMGQTMSEGTIISWHKNEGDYVKKGDVLLEAESDKSIFEIVAEEDGVIKKIFYKEGEVVLVNTTLAYIGGEDEEIPVALESSDTSRDDNLNSALDNANNKVQSEDEKTENNKLIASAGVRKMAKEKGIDLSKVEPSEVDGVIRFKDIKNYLKSQSYEEDYQIIKEESISFLRKRTGEKLQKTARLIPHTTSTIEINALSMREYLKNDRLQNRNSKQIKLTYNDIIITSVAKALREVPEINVIFDGKKIKYIKNVNIGVAVATEKGLVAPVIKNADLKSITEIAVEIKTLIDKAHSGKLLPKDYEHGTFTISNLGMFNIDSFTSIINSPESAILSVGAIVDRAWVINGEIRVCPIFKATLNIDHRILDGLLVAKFQNKLKEVCENVS